MDTKEIRECCENCTYDEIADITCAAADEIDRLEQRVADLEELLVSGVNIHPWGCVDRDGNPLWSASYGIISRAFGKTPQEAIDAAIKASKENGDGA